MLTGKYEQDLYEALEKLRDATRFATYGNLGEVIDHDLAGQQADSILGRIKGDFEDYRARNGC